LILRFICQQLRQSLGAGVFLLSLLFCDAIGFRFFPCVLGSLFLGVLGSFGLGRFSRFLFGVFFGFALGVLCSLLLGSFGLGGFLARLFLGYLACSIRLALYLFFSLLLGLLFGLGARRNSL